MPGSAGTVRDVKSIKFSDETGIVEEVLAAGADGVEPEGGIGGRGVSFV